MHKYLFLRIVKTLHTNRYFQQNSDVVDRMGLSGLQNCTAVIRMLAYGVATDVVDEYIRIGEITANECLDKFTKCIIENFCQQYLRRSKANNFRYWTTTWFSRNARKHWSYALKMEKLSNILERSIPRA